MVDDLIKRLQRKEAELAELRRQVEARQRKRLSSLHTELGFSSAEELIDALRSATGASGRPARSKPASRHDDAAPNADAAGRASKRARLSPKMRQEIEAALLAGEKGAAVARRFGISYPTLHKIKTQVGLVTKRPSRRRRRG